MRLYDLPFFQTEETAETSKNMSDLQFFCSYMGEMGLL